MIKPEHTSKFKDFWTPNNPENDITLRKRLMVTEVPEGRNHTNIKVPPTIEIKLIKGKLASEVKFSYFDPGYSDPEDQTHFGNVPLDINQRNPNNTNYLFYPQQMNHLMPF